MNTFSNFTEGTFSKDLANFVKIFEAAWVKGDELFFIYLDVVDVGNFVCFMVMWVIIFFVWTIFFFRILIDFFITFTFIFVYLLYFSWRPLLILFFSWSF